MLAPGTRLGPYEIQTAIGSGGMGDVYRARDTRLDRIVALKVSRGQFSERFDREARAVAALNHRHICHLYDVGPDYLVMEYVEGTPLGRVGDVPGLINIGIQIADALATAHAAGIVHRDLKPGNVLITRAGEVKILDFGLAKMAPAISLASAPTEGVMTEPGAAVGTVPYMSPEQARGDAVDAGTDLWSLGVVLYELATGKRPFDGPTPAVVYEALLSKAPIPVRQLNPQIPEDLERVVLRLLDKDRATRYQSAADVRADLLRIQRQLSTPSMPVGVIPPRRRPFGRALVYTASALIGIALVLFLLPRPERPVTVPTEYEAITNFDDAASAPALSPDGRMVAFVRGQHFLSTGDIYVKQLPNGEAVRLTTNSNAKYGPVFTPDGTRVAFTQVGRIASGMTWETWTVPVLGGEATRFLPNAAGLGWIGDQEMLFSEVKGTGLHMGIVTAAANRANKREIYYPPHERAMAHYSYLSPDRKWVLISEMDRAAAFQPCRVTPFDGSSAGRLVGPHGACTAAAWSPDGRLMYFSASVDGAWHLWRQTFPSGEPQQITFGPTEEEGVAVAPDGRSLVTSIGQRRSAVWLHTPAGERELSTEGFAFAPNLSADRRRVYYLRRTHATAASTDLRVVDIASGKTETLLTGLATVAYDLSHDEREAVFTRAGSSGDSEIWLAPLDRQTPPQLVARDGDQPSFGAGGELLFRSLEARANFLARVDRDGSGRRHVVEAPILNKAGVSRNGEWVIAMVPGVETEESTRTVAFSTRDGARRVLCLGNCEGGWSADGSLLTLRGVGTRRPEASGVALSLSPGRALPDIASPDGGLDFSRGRTIVVGQILFDADGSSYVFTRQGLQRNLYRIPLH